MQLQVIQTKIYEVETRVLCLQRVQNGGHNIPIDVIERRYNAGIKNLNELYIDFVDSWRIYDNSDNKHEPIAEGTKDKAVNVIKENTYLKIHYGK